MEIVSVQKSKNSKGLYSICLDDGTILSIPEEEYLRLNLYEKKEISKLELEDLRENIEFHAAKAVAIRFVALKLRCENEVREKLMQEGFSSDTADRVIHELKSLGYLNDILFVQKYIYDRSKLKPKSKRMLRLELMEKGISGEDIDSVLDEWKVDEASVAYGLAKKKFGKYDTHDEMILKKIQLFLRHRGFSFDTIREAVRMLHEESEK